MSNILQRIEANYVPIPESGCRIWEASCNSRGYGTIKYKGKTHSSHRLVYELYKGEIPDGMFVCHTCDIPSCVNPNHLFLGLPADNTRDMHNKGRNADFNGENSCKAKLSWEDVREIRDLQKTRLFSHRELGLLYGVARRTICHVINNTSWNRYRNAG